LVGVLGHPDKWQPQTPLRLIGDPQGQIADPGAAPEHRGPHRNSSPGILWALNLCGGLSDEVA